MPKVQVRVCVSHDRWLVGDETEVELTSKIEARIDRGWLILLADQDLDDLEVA